MRTGPHAGDKSGILGVMLRSTLLKDILRTNINEMSPSTGSAMVRTMLREDPEVFFALVSSLPVVVNGMVAASTELAVQLKEKYPPEMLRSFLMGLVGEIDRDGLRKCGVAWANLASSLWEASADIRTEAGRALLRKGPAVVSGCLNRITRGVNAVDPLTLRAFLARVLSGIDAEETRRATAPLAGAMLDQKWHLASWAWSFARSRLMKRLGRGPGATP